MIHLQVKRALRIEARFSWIEWCLKDIDGKVDLAVDLNYRLMNAVNDEANPTRESVKCEVEDLLDEYLQFFDEESGDTACFLDTVLDEIFGAE